MGSHTNYHMVIYQLVLHKDELHRITNDKYQQVIIELSRCKVDSDEDYDNLPDHKVLATKLGYTHSKAYSLLKSLLFDLIVELNEPPLAIDNFMHRLYFHLPYDEIEACNKKYREELWGKAICIDMKLQVTPRIGEAIEITLIQETGNFYSGYVHSIKHHIIGKTQEIHIDIHPWDNYYYKWAKMKDDYERMKKWEEYDRNRVKT